MTQMFWLATSVTSRCISLSAINAPVGLHGELITIALVLGVMACRNASAFIANPSSGYVCTSTGFAPASFTCSVMVGQPGTCVITSLPGLNSAIATL